MSVIFFPSQTGSDSLQDVINDDLLEIGSTIFIEPGTYTVEAGSAISPTNEPLKGRLRNQRFYSLAALNQAIGALLVRLNDQRPIRRLGVTRRPLLGPRLIVR